MLVEPQSQPQPHPDSVDPSFIMRSAWVFLGVALGLAAAFAFVSVGGAFTIAYGGLAVFWLSNYTAYRVGATNYRVRPYIAAHAFLVSIMLMIVSAASTIFG